MMDGMEGLADAVDGVFREIRAKMKEASQHAGIMESLRAFTAAVDWTVRWCQCIEDGFLQGSGNRRRL